MLQTATYYTLLMTEKLKQQWLTAVLFIVVMAGWCKPVLASGEEGIETIYYSRLSGITANPPHSYPLVVNGIAEMNYTVQNEQSKTIRNIITLSVFEETTTYIPANFTASVKVRIEYGHSSTPPFNTIEQVLTVTYNKDEGQKYNAKNYFHFEGAGYVKVTALEVNAPTVGGLDTRKVLVLQNEMRVVRYYELATNVQPATFNGPASINDPADAVPVNWSWAANAGNNHTQLEWTWLENELEQYYFVNGSLNYDLLFRNNATRIDLPLVQTTYSIPLLYNGAGKLYYRIRAVTIKASGNRSDGPWSAVRNCAYTGHGLDLNWQVTTTFAEEGKRKSVIQYFDGSLRSRQTVTKDNVTNTTVTAETYYDLQGRPAVQILPTPGISNVIAYTKNLNAFNAQNDNTDPALVFDLLPLVNADDLKMKTAKGASKYYSPSNPEIGTASNKNIPDAEGYPYSLTRYTPDGTGRVLSQGGVGPAMQPGAGHETKYYYGTPSQEELDGLFGTEVGNFSHYFKNMIKDANGQMSVNYVDMHGRTIATALTGDAPTNTVALNLSAAHYPNQAGTSITRNLLSSNTNIVKGNSLEALNSLLVPVTTSYQFRYELNPEVLQLTACPGISPSTICYDCMYDLEISITDESGELPVILKKYSNISLSADDNCSTLPQKFRDSSNLAATPVNIITFTQTLQPGSYTVRKTLTMSEASLQKYREEYILKGLCKTQTQLIDSVYSALITVTGCNTPPTPVTCEACSTSVGNSTTFRTNYLNSIGNPTVTPALETEIQVAFQKALQTCNKLCGNSVSYSLPTKRQLMLTDMMPYGGQYARESGSGTMHNAYNIFASNKFRNPRNAAGQSAPYYTPLNEVDPVNAILSTVTPADFTQLFNNKWAEALLPHHPEYARLVYAETNLAASYNWINAFSQVETFSEAQTKNYVLTPGNTTATPYNDPFYTVAGTSYRDAMVTKINTNYISDAQVTLNMWQVAYGNLKCKDIMDANLRKSCFVNAPLPPFSSLTAAEKDQVWQAYRNLYMFERDRQVNTFINAAVPLGDAGTLVSQGYMLQFPTEAQQISQNNSNSGGGWSWWPTTPGGTPSVPPANTPAQTYTTRCSSYVEMWKQSLLQCTALANHASRDQILTEITNKMVEVCKKGSDAANPEGSSDVAPGTPNDGNPRSFEEVINSVFATYGIAKTDLCNPYVIEFPKPYGKSPQFTASLVSQLDTCLCTRFTQLKNEATAAGFNPSVLSSLNQFFRNKYGDTITTALFNAYSHCSELGTVSYITSCTTRYQTVSYPCGGPDPCIITVAAAKEQSALRYPACPPGYHWDIGASQCVPDGTGGTCTKQCPYEDCTTTQVVTWYYPLITPQPMPAFMQCGATAGRCVDCATLSLYTVEFKSKFGAPYNTAPIIDSTNLTTDQLAYNILYQKFLNYRTGFQYSWYDYAKAAAAANCNLANPAGNIGNIQGTLSVSSRSGNQPSEYVALEYIEFLPDFTSGENDQFDAYLVNGVPASQTVLCFKPKPLNDTTGVILPEPPCQKTYTKSVALAQQIYEKRVEYLLADFEAAYRAKCMAAKSIEQFSVTYTSKEYHYTLYYFDMAGNLVKTVPPKGVRPDFSTTFLNSVKTARQNGTSVPRPHELVTQYRYNSLNKIVAQKTPDAGLSFFWYDKMGRLTVSQNAQQTADNKYSYTQFDPHGRIIEVGQKPQAAGSMSQTKSQDPAALINWLNNEGGTKEQITFTTYDIPNATSFAGLITQENLRNRVSYTGTKKFATDADYYTASFYSYDIHGNVDTLLQDYRGITEMSSSGNSLKRIVYEYDLISGKVNLLKYQPGEADAFYHQYRYDGDSRLIEVLTSRDRIVWERDAAYTYLKHGMLARTEIGHLRVQGMDYAYTLQGWIKGVNSTHLNPNADIGLDGVSGSSVVARDALGFALHYFDDGAGTNALVDYKSIGATSNFARPASGNNLASLFNGNIGAMTVNNAGLLKGTPASTNALPLFYNYRYDQLNRLVSMQTYKGLNTTSNQWTPVAIDDYKEAITYDPNGNILTYNRKGAPSAGKALEMDALTYNYNAANNQINYIQDITSTYTEDVDGQAANNYTYDANGNVKTDIVRGITSIQWNVYGKIASVTKNSATINYSYDARGHRVTRSGSSKTTIYVRDANGLVLSIYEKPSAGVIKQTELPLYGSNRIGMAQASTVTPQTAILAAGWGSAKIVTFTRGDKYFELNNHLGNVMVTITDKKLQIVSGSDPNAIDHFEADIVTASDYYPFGMTMPGRKYIAVNALAYRYGFSGQERSGELHDESYTAEFWEYDATIGRRWNVDPEYKSQPWESPYATFNNGPIWKSDPSGKLPIIIVWALKKLGQAAVYIVTDIAIQAAIEHYIVGKDWKDIDIDWWAAIGSGGEAFVSSKKLRVLMSAGWDMLTYSFEADDWTLEGFLGAGLKGGLSEIIGDKAGDLIAKYGSRAVKGIGKMLGEKYEKLAISHLWDQFPGHIRGSELEKYWVEKFAGGWEYVGQLKNGFYAAIDVWKNGIGLSVKTTKALTEEGQQKFIKDVKKNIDDMVKMRRTGVHPDDQRRINEVRLLILTPDDANYNRNWLSELENYARQNNVPFFQQRL